MDVTGERARRAEMWQAIAREDLRNLEPALLRALGIYGGAQGVWVDKARTSVTTDDGHGATVGILHTGRHYADDLSEDGMIYHYPLTGRGSARDATEVQATKNAMSLKLPVFVILPGEGSLSKRTLKLGWVVDFDDQTRQFLILFGSLEAPPTYELASEPESAFKLEDDQPRIPRPAYARPGQQRFRFQVIEKYGCKCAVCDISHSMLIEAAHIRGKGNRGSDDWRNGLPLCSTHRAAFDGLLFGVEPDSYAIRCKPGLEALVLGLRTAKLALLKNGPHVDALSWRWTATLRAWNTASADRESHD
jgi:putative restriction endonuclease